MIKTMWALRTALFLVTLCYLGAFAQVSSGQRTALDVCRRVAEASCAAARSICDTIDPTTGATAESRPGTGVPSVNSNPNRPSVDFSGLRRPTGTNPDAEEAVVIDEAVLNKAREVARANTQFALKLYDTLAGGKPTENIFFSPISISTTMAMVSMGANGNTREEMENVLSIANIPDKNDRFHTLDRVLFGEETPYILRTANRLFTNPSYPFQQRYLQVMRSVFNASSQQVNFRDAVTAASDINRFVEERTQSKIKDMLSPSLLNPATAMVLVNAIYFKGTWRQQFDQKVTNSRTWYKSLTAVSSNPRTNMMFQRGNFNYKYDSDTRTRIVELPYNGETSMYVILPEIYDGYREVERKLSSPQVLEQTLSGLENRTLDLHLPRFTLKNMKIDLKRTLRSLGMVDVFSRVRADLSGMTGLRNDLYISAAIHEAFVEVNEEGTEAAAATAAVASSRSMVNYPIFRADHPFVFLIREKRTGTVLFMGRLMDPTA